jgi:para-aminobenzoate synthetase/4-amino-4-deoxychorismate lyase
VAADLHLERLSRSLLELYGEPLPPDARMLLDEAAARSPEPARLRLTAAPEVPSGGVRLRLERTALPALEPVRLRTVTLPGGLGEHKWVDRRLLDALVARHPGHLALLVDLDGQVLEAGPG